MMRSVDADAVRALVRVEIQRQWPQFLKMFAVMGAILLVAIFTGGSRDNGFAAGLGASLLLGLPALAAMQIMRDRLDGSLEFFCSLPVTGETMAAARFTVLAAIALLTAVLNLAALVLTDAAARLDYPNLAVYVGTFGLGWAVPLALGATTCALGSRFRMETVLMLPFGVLICIAAFGATISRYLAASSAAAPLRQIFVATWFVPVATLAAFIVCISITLAAFRFTASSLAAFVPAPDRR